MSTWRKPYEVGDRVVPFTALAVAIGLLLVLMPSTARSGDEIALGAAIGLGLIVLAFARRSIPAVTVVVPIGYILFAAILRDGTGGSRSGFSGLFLLSVLWIALAGTRFDVLTGLAAMAAAQFVPLVAVGGVAYPSSGLRGSLVQLAVAAIAGLTVQTLVAEARAHAVRSLDHAQELEAASEQLADQNERLDELDQMKDDFIALVSHELRTPLTSIIGYLEMALEDSSTLTELQESFLTTVQRNVERLADLVNDLLFLARVDSGKLELEPEPLEFREVIEQTIETVRPVAGAKQVDLVLEIDGSAPIRGDRARLGQLVDNLVANAIKFTPEGGVVTISAQTNGDGIDVAVRDTGIGIAAEEIPLLFTRFFRTSTAKANQIPGTGLGLVISQSIAEAHGSSIEVESELGTGTTFRFVLPVAKQIAVA